MTTHNTVRNLLYEYVCDELSQEDYTVVESHLRTCQKCRSEVEELRAAITIPFGHLRSAADERTPEFWGEFSRKVERRIVSVQPVKEKSFLEEWEAFVSSMIVRPRRLAIVGGVVAVIVAVLLAGKSYFSGGKEDAVQTARRAETESVEETTSRNVLQANERMGQYFRKSRALLVGVTNMKLDDDQPVDLSTEQTVSRELVHEARYLKNQPIDMRSAKLIGDLEKILIELANLKEDHDIPNVEIIRAGIHQENLLFKIRMAETCLDTSQHHTNSY